MKIENDRFVSIDYRLTLDSGEVVDQSAPDAPLGFIYGAGMIIPGLERALAGMEVGQKAAVTVEPPEGYGLPNPSLYQEVPRRLFPEDTLPAPGMEFHAEGPHGPMRFRVKAVEGETVVADFNHPLAGARLHFDVQVREVRESTPAEQQEARRSPACSCDDGGCGGGEDDSFGGCGGGCGSGGCG